MFRTTRAFDDFDGTTMVLSDFVPSAFAISKSEFLFVRVMISRSLLRSRPRFGLLKIPILHA